MLFDFIKRFWLVNPAMGLFAPGGGSAGRYQITNSLRLRASASAYLSRTPSAGGTRTKWTLSKWVKRSRFNGTRDALLCVGTASNDTDTIQCGFWNAGANETFFIGGGVTAWKRTNNLYRDPSAWYHIFIVCDTSLGAGNRLKLYINGAIPSLATDSEPGSGANTAVFNNAVHYIGYDQNGVNYMDGYLAEDYLLENVAASVTDFGQFDSNGVWVPKPYAGTYGTRGHKLDFKDAAVTAGSNAGLGKDVSGNGNYWTTNNISVTAGVTYDVMTDTPTNNYCTLSPLHPASSGMSAANLTHKPSSNNLGSMSSMAVPDTGVWWAEFTCEALPGGYELAVGLNTAVAVLNDALRGGRGTSWSYEAGSGTKFIDSTGAGAAYGSTWTANDVIGILVDRGAATLTFYKQTGGTGNFVSQGAITSLPTTKTYWWIGSGGGASAVGGAWNFGQRTFNYVTQHGSLPSSAKSLCTANLPSVAIKKPASHFDVVTRTGTAASYTKTGLLFQTDFVWNKARSAGDHHFLQDCVRGFGASKSLSSSTTGAEGANGGAPASHSFAATSDGFTLGASDSDWNANTVTHVDWLWKAGGAPSTDNVAGAGNTPTAGSVKIDGANLGSALAGSIAATRLSANTTAGFSIVTYTGNGTNGATVGHGLGSTPKLVIVKNRDGTRSWMAYHANLTASNNLYLNGTSTQFTLASSSDGGIGGVSSTTFTCSQGSINTNATNENLKTFVAYCFAEIAGYSKFGSYVGNASSDGPFVYCGFRPKYIMWKNASAASDWHIQDVSRETYNQSITPLHPNLASAESPDTSYAVDFLANGFKVRTTAAAKNGSTNTITYAAFAEHPFGGSNVSPAPAR